MEFGLGTFGLSVAAGSLSTLSPCVLPLVPILLGSAVTAHRLGPFALAAGLSVSFALVGIFFASLGVSLGLDQEALRNIAAVMLLLFGAILLSSFLQERFAGATAALSSAGQNLLCKVTLNGFTGQFMLGLLLGMVWSPCVGPTLGAAIGLASQGQNIAQVSVVMALFGIGAGLPLVVLGLLSRRAMARMRGSLLVAGKYGKQILGVVMLAIGILILTGADKAFETWVLDVAPPWLVALTTSI